MGGGYNGRGGLGRGVFVGMDEAVAAARKRGTRSLYLEVREANHVARQLYHSAGFEVVGVRKQYYTEPVEDAIVMRLELEDTVR